MLQTVQEDGFFYWQCVGEQCSALIRAHITDQAVCRRVSPLSGKGDVIALPLCPVCGEEQLFLKADYKLKEVLHHGKMLHWFSDQGRLRGAAMELRYARSFRFLNMLYDAGKLPSPPLLRVLPFGMIKQSALRGLPYDVVDSFFLPYALFGRAIDYDSIDTHIVTLAAKAGIAPLLPEPSTASVRLQ